MRRTHPANVFVCECITQSLFRLMKRKPYNKITVTDLVHEAGVSRNSFYRNYQSTEEIIRQFLEERTSKWWNGFIIYPARYPHVISEMFHHFLDMKEEINLLYHAGLSHLLMEHTDINSDKVVLRRRDTLHNETLYTANGYVTAWFMWHLQGDKEASKAFIGDTPEIFINSLYQDQNADVKPII